jgi:hypothetical protein
MIKSANIDNKILITVDPGKTGAIVVCKYENGNFEILKTHSFDFCADYFEIACVISEVASFALKESLKLKIGVLAAVEKPFPIPINSRLTISIQFALYGSILLALQQQFAIKIIELCPSAWITQTCTKEERLLKKPGRFLACDRIFGSEIKNHYVIKNKKNKFKLHDGKADALLMCSYIAKNNIPKKI